MRIEPGFQNWNPMALTNKVITTACALPVISSNAETESKMLLIQNKFSSLYFIDLNYLTRNATHCNNHDNLLLHSFFLKISIFSKVYINISQSNIYDGAFIAKIVSRSVCSQKSSIGGTRLGSKYTSAFRRLLKRFISLKYFTL